MMQGWGRMQAILEILIVPNSFKDHSEVGHTREDIPGLPGTQIMADKKN